MQCTNPRLDFLRESLASIFNQVYPFHRLYIVDRGSSDKAVRDLIQEMEKDSRVKVSFQKRSRTRHGSNRTNHEKSRQRMAAADGRRRCN